MSKRVTNSVFLLAGVMAAGAFVSGALADDALVTFGFTDLDSSFDPNTSLFTAQAVDQGNLHSGGDVSRLIGSPGDAQFDSGFKSLGTLGDFGLSMTISNIVNNTALGSGSLLITDANGDTISAAISGDWSLVGGLFYVFKGSLDSVFVNDNSGDGLFDGPSSGSFSTSFLSAQPYSGAAVYLYFGKPGGFFSKQFAGVSGEISGEIVPGPGAAVLLGVGGLVGMTRRRSKR